MAEVTGVASMTASVSHNIQPDAVGVGKVFSVCRMSGGLHVDLRGARRRPDPQQPGLHHHPRDVRQRQSPWGRRLARTQRRARRQQIIGVTVRVMSMGARPDAYSAAIFSRSAAAFNSAAFASTNSTMWSTITAPSMV